MLFFCFDLGCIAFCFVCVCVLFFFAFLRFALCRFSLVYLVLFRSNPIFFASQSFWSTKMHHYGCPVVHNTVKCLQHNRNKPQHGEISTTKIGKIGKLAQKKFEKLVTRPRLRWILRSPPRWVVLEFLQEMLDKQRFSSTIKVYAEAIAAIHAPVAGRSVGRDTIFTRRQENKSPTSSYSSTLGLTNRTKGPKRAPVWTIAILEPQCTLVGNRPAVSTGVGQASRRPAGPFR